ncbi:hypothetical protein Ahy_B09g096331 isoform A [Arachis hypogaea]|uniref:Nicotianamine synthase n=1 Tax=Arachis hypogaea TaxID=3818 RepID=A0A444XK03_ARAHY|nr:hypothetical protein Ahy_B09g096331 isoform A [Arachis hypogaea]
MVCQEQEALVNKVLDLYHKISTLDTLKPSQDVDTLFTQLVRTCIPHTPFIDITKLSTTVQEARSDLIRLCAILSQHCQAVPTKIAFVGSGPLPLTSIVLATNHFPNTTFHNYDIDALANSMAKALVSSDHDLSKRMVFHTSDILDVSHGLNEFNVVFLAALVGMKNEEKKKVIDHLGKYMAPGAFLMVRSAYSARAFLYPVVNPSFDLKGFEVLSVFHPTDEVINSIVIAQKCPIISTSSKEVESVFSNNNLLINGNMIEELVTEEQL